jgi:hypothetical protein
MYGFAIEGELVDVMHQAQAEVYRSMLVLATLGSFGFDPGVVGETDNGFHPLQQLDRVAPGCHCRFDLGGHFRR